MEWVINYTQPITRIHRVVSKTLGKQARFDLAVSTRGEISESFKSSMVKRGEKEKGRTLLYC